MLQIFRFKKKSITVVVLYQSKSMLIDAIILVDLHTTLPDALSMFLLSWCTDCLCDTISFSFFFLSLLPDWQLSRCFLDVVVAFNQSLQFESISCRYRFVAIRLLDLFSENRVKSSKSMFFLLVVVQSPKSPKSPKKLVKLLHSNCCGPTLSVDFARLLQLQSDSVLLAHKRKANLFVSNLAPLCQRIRPNGTAKARPVETQFNVASRWLLRIHIYEDDHRWWWGCDVIISIFQPCPDVWKCV